MKARTLGSQLAVLALVSSLAACTRVDGPHSTETRNVEPFTSIELRGSATLDVLVGEAQSVVVDSDEQGLRTLRTSVHRGRLVIDTNDHAFWLRDAEYKVRITTTQLESLALHGATSASIHGLSGGKTKLILNGAGEVEASGTVDEVVAQVNGAGSVDLEHLVATDADVSVHGTGNISVQATGRLKAEINGVGNIEYLGKPRDLDTAIHGVGSIEQKKPN